MRSETSIDISMLLALLATSLLPVSIMLNYNTLEDSFLGLPITVLLLMGLVYNMPIKNTPLMANSVNNVSNSTISK